ncbi:MAG: AbrB/MazE/SpoVT family DNA-binding domain-containing protein [Clostridia bacterium]|nr:AbrB/MazE/SpoVT family DNA-binding domain-containing protein [Clostridia bacterium]
MKATGIVRRVDVLGRVVVPKEIRKILSINEGDPLEIFTEKDAIILRKYSPLSNIDELANNVAQALFRQTRKEIFVCDKDTFISASGHGVKEILGKDISEDIHQLIINRQTLISSFSNGNMPLKLADGENFGFFNQLVMPIRIDGEALGAIILCDKDKDTKISSNEIELTELACEVLAGKFR